MLPGCTAVGLGRVVCRRQRPGAFSGTRLGASGGRSWLAHSSRPVVCPRPRWGEFSGTRPPGGPHHAGVLPGAGLSLLMAQEDGDSTTMTLVTDGNGTLRTRIPDEPEGVDHEVYRWALGDSVSTSGAPTLQALSEGCFAIDAADPGADTARC